MDCVVDIAIYIYYIVLAFGFQRCYLLLPTALVLYSLVNM